MNFISIIDTNIFLIIRLSNSVQLQNDIFKNPKLICQTIVIPCKNLDQTQLVYWIKNQACSMNLYLNNDSVELLCFFYENNLVELSQQLEILSLIFYKKKLTLDLLKEFVINSQVFNILDWINALLEGNIKRALHILSNLLQKKVELVFLLRILQKDIIILLNIINSNYDFIKQQKFFFSYKKRKLIFMRASQRLTKKNIIKIVNLLYKIEILFKKNCTNLVWNYLEILSILFCYDLS